MNEKDLVKDAQMGAREELEGLLNSVLPEEKRTGDVDRMALDYIKAQLDVNRRISEALADEPKLAHVFAGLINGDHSAARSLAYAFGREFFSAEEGSPEYEEFIAGDEQRKQEDAERKSWVEEFNGNLDVSMKELEQACEEVGVPVEEYKNRIRDLFITPILDGKISKDEWKGMIKAIDYDKDTEDAFTAGEIAGRNTNINAMREDLGDGMPKGLSSQTVEPKKRIKRYNPMIESALNA